MRTHNIREAVRARAEELNSEAELARRTGLSKTTISRIVRNHTSHVKETTRERLWNEIKHLYDGPPPESVVIAEARGEYSGSRPICGEIHAESPQATKLLSILAVLPTAWKQRVVDAADEVLIEYVRNQNASKQAG
jgi:hypothetical protein